MNDYAGESGGGSSAPQPTIEYKAVEMETVSVMAFGEALIKDAEGLKDAAKKISEQLKNPEGDHGAESMQPVGADPRQETLHDLVIIHSQRMHETNQYLQMAEVAIRNLGLMSRYIATSIGDVDALNATDVDRVKSVIDEVAKPKSEEV